MVGWCGRSFVLGYSGLCDDASDGVVAVLYVVWVPIVLCCTGGYELIYFLLCLKWVVFVH